jgi:hypothetical protein
MAKPWHASARVSADHPTTATAAGERAPQLLEALGLHDWSGGTTAEAQERALAALESGRIVLLADLAFDLAPSERRFLDPLVSDGTAKNISFDPVSGRVAGTALAGADREDLAALLGRFGREARVLLAGLLPDYAPHLQWGRASLRPVRIEARRMSSRQDDTRLHVDAFRSRPVQGRRILRVFTNINREGVARVWRVGEPFPAYAGRFLRPRPLSPPHGAAAMLALLGITKGRRSAYDWLMLSLHDRAKRDDAYQQRGVVAEVAFPAGSTWIVYTDLVPHAAIAGQHALEQTFHLPVAAMRHPELAPLRILETLTHRRLTA